MHPGVLSGPIGIVGSDVERILNQIHATQVVEVVGVGQRQGILTVGEECQYTLLVPFGHGLIADAHTYQVTVVIGFEAVIVLGEPTVELVEVGHGGFHVFEFVFENHRHIEKAVGNDFVRSGDSLLGKGQLLKIETRILGVITERRGIGFGLRFFIGQGLGVVILLPAPFGNVGLGERSLVAAAPIVFELTASPLALELRLSGRYQRSVVEIPRRASARHGGCRYLLYLVELGSIGLLLGQQSGPTGLLGSGLFGSNEVVDNLLDMAVALLFGHGGYPLQTVLQLNIAGIHRQLVEYRRAPHQIGIVGVTLVDQRQGLGITGLRLGVLAAFKIDTSQRQLTDG